MNPSDDLSRLSNDELLSILWNGLNKANLKGVYNIDEAYLLKICYSKLKNTISQNNNQQSNNHNNNENNDYRLDIP
jgi:hypothetical protein